MQHADLLDLRPRPEIFQRFSTSMPPGGRVLKAHFTWSRCCGRMEQSTNRDLGPHHDGRRGEIAGRDAAADEDVHIVRADHLR